MLKHRHENTALCTDHSTQLESRTSRSKKDPSIPNIHGMRTEKTAVASHKKEEVGD